MILKCEQLSFFYTSKQKIFSGLDFETSSGRLMAVAGANGGGKSTLINILAGILKPTSGSFFFTDDSGKRINNILPGSALLPQNIDHWLLGETGREDLKLGLDLKNKDSRKLLEELIKRWQLEQLLDLPVDNLSLGERKRIALVAALAKKPPAIFLDEPLSGLDWPGSKLFLSDLEHLKSCGVICILVSHAPDLIAPLVDDWLLLRDGRHFFSCGTKAYAHFEDFGVRPVH